MWSGAMLAVNQAPPVDLSASRSSISEGPDPGVACQKLLAYCTAEKGFAPAVLAGRF